MDKRVIFNDEEGKMCVLIPCDKSMTIEQIAQKDVPSGLPYKIVDKSYLPDNRDDRENWSIDTSELTDGVGA